MSKNARSTALGSVCDIPEVAAYLARIGAEARSLFTAVIRSDEGSYKRDICTIKFSRHGEITVSNKEYAPTSNETHAIKEAISKAHLPSMETPARLPSPPKRFKDASESNRFVFRDVEKRILMLQVRVQHKNGARSYIPITHWNDGEWREIEPEGLLPLWGLDQLKGHSTVFIHEGAKAARYCREMVEGETPEARERRKVHPWGDELDCAAHLGWIGGAASPHRTDWAILKKFGVKRVYIVADNDDAGRKAVPHISRETRLPCFLVQFTSEWPAGFDLADPFPDDMFRAIDGRAQYVGPPFSSCLHPATWATDQFKGEGGGTVTVLRSHFADQWVFAEQIDRFVHLELPDIVRSEPLFNKMVAPFSHSSRTASLLIREFRGRTAKVTYLPGEPNRLVNEGTTSAINLHVPPGIQATPGDAQPWLDYLRYMFPIDEERRQAERWIATLIARPGTRMLYGLLLVSERQGIGKTTLCEKVLLPLIGLQNTSIPSEHDIAHSQFNGWMARKRLVIVGEIYSGQSWKAYQRLKQVITDRSVDVNEKHEKPYTIDNWVHVVACSNSRAPLKMDASDRRWFYPTLPEEPWSKSKFTGFHDWLSSGGLPIIKHWAQVYGDYVGTGEDAPTSDRKRELIEISRSETAQEAIALAVMLAERDQATCVTLRDVMSWLREKAAHRVFDQDYEIKRVMTESGMRALEQRIKIAGRTEYVLYNPAMANLIDQLQTRMDPTDAKAYSAALNALLRQHLQTVRTLVDTPM